MTRISNQPLIQLPENSEAEVAINTLLASGARGDALAKGMDVVREKLGDTWSTAEVGAVRGLMAGLDVEGRLDPSLRSSLEGRIESEDQRSLQFRAQCFNRAGKISIAAVGTGLFAVGVGFATGGLGVPFGIAIGGLLMGAGGVAPFEGAYNKAAAYGVTRFEAVLAAEVPPRQG